MIGCRSVSLLTYSKLNISNRASTKFPHMSIALISGTAGTISAAGLGMRYAVRTGHASGIGAHGV